ncbi:MAG: ferredoxin--NADP reductase [Proteobacteria bacterium]|nr:ferredoxin--NADP reductase [Pseudomonadota bacterium]
MSADEYNATVIQKILMTPGLMTLRVRPDGEAPAFTPGQYIALGLSSSEPRVKESEPDPTIYKRECLVRRVYSISSSSVDKEYIEFYISMVRNGQLTPRLFTLKQGSKLFMGPKAVGMFTLDEIPEHKNVIFIATGTGLAPYMSMIRSEFHLQKKRKFAVLHGASCSWDLGYRDELATMDRLTERFIYLPTITDPAKDPTWNGLTGLIQPITKSGILEEKTGLDLTPENFDIFLCGNPLMVDETTKILLSRGFTPDVKKEIGTLHRERYW